MNTSDTTQFWWMRAESTNADKILRLERSKPPKFSFVNRQEIFDAFLKEGAFGKRSNRPAQQAPQAIFKVSSDSVTPSILWGSLSFFSTSLREALGLEKDCVQYLDVDASQCHPNFKAMDYKLAHFLQRGDAVDLEASDFEFYSQSAPDGSLEEGWRPNREMQLKRLPIKIIFKENFVPPAPLFIQNRHEMLLATDELASRVLNSGITDVTFQDICYVDPTFQSIRVKTTEGAEILGRKANLT